MNFSKHDRNYERFLAGPALVKDGKVDIGSYCHGPSQVSVSGKEFGARRKAF